MKVKSRLQITAREIEEIYKKSNGMNLPLVKEANRQVELKLYDERLRKERIDNRAFTMLTVQLTLIGLIVGGISSANLEPIVAILLSLAGLCLLVGTYYLFQVLRAHIYPPLGTYPSSWLSRGYLENHQEEQHNKHILALATCRLLYSQEYNIKVGDESSNQRLKMLNKSLKMGQLSMLCVAICLVFKIFQLASSLGA